VSGKKPAVTQACAPPFLLLYALRDGFDRNRSAERVTAEDDEAVNAEGGATPWRF
jgi:hypothetical protein